MVSSEECRICNAKKERETEGKEEGDVDALGRAWEQKPRRWLYMINYCALKNFPFYDV